MITKKFDQVSRPVSQIFKEGEIVVNNFLPFTGKVISLDDETQEVVFVEATAEEEAKRMAELLAHLDLDDED